MGLLRFIFSLSVVLGHTDLQNAFVGGRNAVQMFYMVSGFLISFVLTKANTYSNVSDFYKSRLLRLYPIYALMAFISLIGNLAFNNAFILVYRGAPILAKIILLVSNITLIGQDWVMFLATHKGVLAFSVDYHNSDVLLYKGLIIPQAWTLGVEMSFYLIAPFILLRKRYIILFLFLSLGIRLLLLTHGLGLKDPWTYRFFPSELANFLLGALSQQVLLPIYKEKLQTRMKLISSAVTISFALICLFVTPLPISILVKTFSIQGLFLLILPFAFEFQNMHVWDRKIGNLSYPLYIGHGIAIDIVDFCTSKFRATPEWADIALKVSLAILIAYILDKYVAQPIEGYRTRFKHKERQVSDGEGVQADGLRSPGSG